MKQEVTIFRRVRRHLGLGHLLSLVHLESDGGMAKWGFDLEPVLILESGSVCFLRVRSFLLIFSLKKCHIIKNMTNHFSVSHLGNITNGI